MPGCMGLAHQKSQVRLEVTPSENLTTEDQHERTIHHSSSTNDLPRCQHRTRTGRRCRHAVSSAAGGLCAKHAPSRPNRFEESDLSASLTEFKSAVPINGFLSRLLLLEAEDRISPRRAAVMAYTCNLILRTLPAIDRELHPEDQDERQIIIDLPPPAATIPFLQATPSWIGSPRRPRPKFQGALMRITSCGRGRRFGRDRSTGRGRGTLSLGRAAETRTRPRRRLW